MTVAKDDVVAAALRIGPHVHWTPVVRSRLLDAWAGAQVHSKAENLQRMGAFKIRGATNAVLRLPDHVAGRGVAAHSSGNHGAALALAAAIRGIPAHIVIPSDTPEVKKAAMETYGARITECEATLAAREAAVAEVIAATGAVEIHPYDNDDVIAGAGTAALELVAEVPDLDVVVAPVGGGGLISGTSLAVRDAGIRIVGAEPAAADDAARSLESGELVPQEAPATMADGLRTSLSERTFRIISEHVERIVTVEEAEIVEAMSFMWTRLKLVVEPSGAVAVAGLRKLDLGGARVGVIISGGNVELPGDPFQPAPGRR